MKADLGPFTTLVSTAGSLMAAAAALLFTFRRRAKWEPVEQDVPRGAERVGGLLIAVAIAVLWIEKDTIAAIQFAWAAGTLAVVAFLALLLYGVFIAALVKDRLVVVSTNKTGTEKIIGGFWLTKAAKASVAAGQPVQEVLASAGYKPDMVWPPVSRALAKMCFVVCYVMLIAAGTIALTCASLLIGKAEAKAPPNPATATETTR